MPSAILKSAIPPWLHSAKEKEDTTWAQHFLEGALKQIHTQPAVQQLTPAASLALVSDEPGTDGRLNKSSPTEARMQAAPTSHNPEAALQNQPHPLWAS